MPTTETEELESFIMENWTLLDDNQKRLLEIVGIKKGDSIAD